MEKRRMPKMKWTLLSALVWLGFADMSYEKFQAMLLRPDYADLLQGGDYKALFRKREILAMSDELRWHAIGVAPIIVVFFLVQLMLLVTFLLRLWN